MKLYYCFFFIVTFFTARSQDVIYKSTDTILAKIIEVNIDEIKYKKHTNLDGPVYTINKSEIEKIIYSNGDIEYFKTLKCFATIYIIRPNLNTMYKNKMTIFENGKNIGIIKYNPDDTDIYNG